MKITIIGVGNMGSAIMKGLSHTQNFTLSAMNPVNPRVTSLAEELGLNSLIQIVKWLTLHLIS